MKTLRFIVMALFAAVLSMNLTACSSDSDGDNAGQGNKENQESNWNFVQKYITALQSNYVNSETNETVDRTFNISYNAKNLLAGIDYVGNSTDNETWSQAHTTWNFDYDNLYMNMYSTWQSGRVGGMSNGSSSGGGFYFITDENGRITATSSSLNGPTTLYTYDENNHLISSEQGQNGITSKYTWQNGNLVEIEIPDPYGYYKTIYNLEYGNLANDGNILPCNCIEIEPFNDIFYIVMSSGMFGKLSKNLPTKITRLSSYGENSTTVWVEKYTYDLDEQGFVTSIKNKGISTSVIYRE